MSPHRKRLTVIGTVSALVVAGGIAGGAGRGQPERGPYVGVTSYMLGGYHHAVAWKEGRFGGLEPAARGYVKVGGGARANADAAGEAEPGEEFALADGVEVEAARQQESYADALDEIGVESARMSICRGSPVPSGWIKVDDYWSPTSCGNPTNITYNVWVIEKYSNKKVNSVMDVCSSAPTPPGWVVVGKHWNPNRCGHPTSITNNVKRIKRVN